MADFKVQRGTVWMDANATTTSITAGVDYTAPAAVDKAFIRIVAHQALSDGIAGQFSGISSSGVVIQNPEDLLSTITFLRGSSGAEAHGVQWEIIEYIGADGGANEFRVRHQARLQAAASSAEERVAVSGVVEAADVAVFITGSRVVGASRAPRTENEELSWITSYDDTADEAVCNRATDRGFQRDSDVSIAVVEFSGSNWSVQRVQHAYAANDTWEVEAIASVGTPANAFIQYQHLLNASAANPLRAGARCYLSAGDEVSFYKRSGYDITTANVWVVANSAGLQTQRLNGTWASSANHPDSVAVSITAVADMEQASIWGETSELTNNTTSDGLRVLLGCRLSALDEVTLHRGASYDGRTYYLEVMEWPGVIEGGVSNRYQMVI